MFRNKNKIAFLKWFPYDKRNESISAAIGANCYFISSLKRRGIFNAPIRYIIQFIKTIIYLSKERPNVIIITNPPIFAVATVAVFCSMKGIKYIIDSHSGAFEKSWRSFKFLHKILAKNAYLNIVTCLAYEKVIKEWGGMTLILSDVVSHIPQKNWYKVSPKFNIVVISSFSPDEPISEIISAARELPETNFYVTGDYKRNNIILKGCPENVVLTGFLPDQNYFDLLHASDSIMVLVNTENTMQQGAYEAVSVRKPMILTEWKALKEIYTEGVIFVKNDKDGIAEGVREMIRNYSRYSREMESLFKERKKVWDQKCQWLIDFLG